MAVVGWCGQTACGSRSPPNHGPNTPERSHSTRSRAVAKMTLIHFLIRATSQEPMARGPLISLLVPRPSSTTEYH